MIAFASACTVETQWPSSMTHPTSQQCGIPRIEPLYPVDRIVRSRTITAPTCLRGQVERDATCPAMFMKYVCQSTRCSVIAGIMPEPSKRPAADGRMSESSGATESSRRHHGNGGRHLGRRLAGG